MPRNRDTERSLDVRLRNMPVALVSAIQALEQDNVDANRLKSALGALVASTFSFVRHLQAGEKDIDSELAELLSEKSIFDRLRGGLFGNRREQLLKLLVAGKLDDKGYIELVSRFPSNNIGGIADMANLGTEENSGNLSQKHATDVQGREKNNEASYTAPVELNETTKGQRLRLKGGRLVRTQISLLPSLKQALEEVAAAQDTSASLIINDLLENDPRIQRALDPEH